MADHLQFLQKEVISKFTMDVKEALDSESYSIFLEVLKAKEPINTINREDIRNKVSELFGNRDDLMQIWMKFDGESFPPDTPFYSAEIITKLPKDWEDAEKQKRKTGSDGKIKVLKKNDSLENDKENLGMNKPLTESDTGGEKYDQWLRKAMKQRKSIKKMLDPMKKDHPKDKDILSENRPIVQSTMGLEKRENFDQVLFQKLEKLTVKAESDRKSQGSIKNEPPKDDKENLREKRHFDLAKGSTKYDQALVRALDFLWDVRSDLLPSNPEAYRKFLGIFEESKQRERDLSDRLRVVAEAMDVIGHRSDLMQRLVDFAMSDLPLQPLGGVKQENVKGGKE